MADRAEWIVFFRAWLDRWSRLPETCRPNDNLELRARRDFEAQRAG